MLRSFARRLFVLLGLAPAALALQVDAPTGFNLETRPDAGPQMLALPDGSELLGISGPSDSIARRLPNNVVIPFASGFSSLAGAALSPVTGDIVVGDSAASAPLYVLRDLNADLDCLDAGEMVAHAAVLPLLSNGAAPLPYDLAFKPGTDDLYVSGSTPFTAGPTLGVVLRVSGGSVSIFGEGFGYAADLVWTGATLNVADVDANTFAGRVVRLTDGNADDDALDAGEASLFATGLSGANGLAIAQDGTVYVSGMYDFVSGKSSVARLLPDADDDGFSDGVDEAFLTGFSFSGPLTLTEGVGGFVPGVSGNGTLIVSDFGFAGDYIVRTAPLAGTTVTGTVANNAAFTTTLSGAAGAGAILVLSLDQSGLTLAGIGDLGLGFGAPHFIVPLAPLSGAGTSALTTTIHNHPELVGTAFTVQGFTVEAGEVGLGDAIDLVIDA